MLGSQAPEYHEPAQLLLHILLHPRDVPFELIRMPQHLLQFDPALSTNSSASGLHACTGCNATQWGVSTLNAWQLGSHLSSLVCGALSCGFVVTVAVAWAPGSRSGCKGTVSGAQGRVLPHFSCAVLSAMLGCGAQQLADFAGP